MDVGKKRPVSASTDSLLHAVSVLYGKLSIVLVRANARVLLARLSFY